MAGVENNPFDKSKLTQKQIDAAKKIMEAYGKNGNINFSNYDISNLSIFIGDLAKWEGNVNSDDANVKSLFADFGKLGLENVYNFIDADGKNGISQEEISNFNLLDSDYAEFLPYQMNSSGQYRTASNITEFDFEGLITSASNAANSAGSADTPETNPPTTNPPATNPPATNPPATNPPATNPPAASTTEVKPKNADKDGNSYVIVTPWGKKESGKDQNDCLLRIIQNNYNKDIKYGTEEYWTYANAVMEANPQIYDKGRKIVGGSKVDSTVIYTGEKIKLPTVNIETKTPPATNPPAENPPAENPPAENPPAENPPAENPPASNTPTNKTEVKDGSYLDKIGASYSVPNLDANGKSIGKIYYDNSEPPKEICRSTVTSTPVYEYGQIVGGKTVESFKIGDKSVEITSVDGKSGSTTNVKETVMRYNYADITETYTNGSTVVVTNSKEGMSGSTKSRITTKDGVNYTISTYDYATKTWSSEVKCDKTGKKLETQDPADPVGSSYTPKAEVIELADNLSTTLKETIATECKNRKQTYQLYKEQLDILKKDILNLDADELQQLISEMSVEDLKNLSTMLDASYTHGFLSMGCTTVDESQQDLIDRLFTPNLEYPENVAKLQKFISDIPKDSDGWPTYSVNYTIQTSFEENFANTLKNSYTFESMSNEDRASILNSYLNAQGMSGIDPELVEKIFTPTGNNYKAINDILETVEKAGTIDENYKYIAEDVIKNKLKTFTKDDFTAFIKEHGIKDIDAYMMKLTGVTKITDIPGYTSYVIAKNALE